MSEAGLRLTPGGSKTSQPELLQARAGAQEGVWFTFEYQNPPFLWVLNMKFFVLTGPYNSKYWQV